jgi:hypothetical protein
MLIYYSQRIDYTRFHKRLVFLLFEMHDFDNVINSVSGQVNYMDSLTKIIGNIQHIDLDTYKSARDTIVKHESTLKDFIGKFNEESLRNTELRTKFDEYLSASSSVDMEHKSVIWYKKKAGKKTSQKNRDKPARERVSDDHYPSKLVKSPWFQSIKHLERSARKLLAILEFDNDKQLNDNWEVINKRFTEDPNQRDIHSWFDYKINTKEDLLRMVLFKDTCVKLMEPLLLPMYDHRATIAKNWHLVANVFNANSEMTPALVQDVLAKFTVARYRCEIFGTTKYYMKLFGEVLNSTAVMNENGDLDGSKFMDVIDSIDLDKFDKPANTYKFITAATPIMRKLVDPNCKESMEDILKEINEAIQPKEAAPALEANEAKDENADIF